MRDSGVATNYGFVGEVAPCIFLSRRDIEDKKEEKMRMHFPIQKILIIHEYKISSYVYILKMYDLLI